MGFSLLLIGHFFGDFVLQTNKIAFMKTKYNRWLILHVTIVTLSTFIMALPMGYSTLMFVVLNGLIHFCIDWLKIHKFNRKDRTIPYFFIDQGFHIVLLLMISLYPNNVSGVESNMYLNWILYIILSLWVVNIITQLFLHEIYGKSRPFFYKYEVTIGHIEKTLALIGVYIYTVNVYAFLVILFLSAFMSPVISSKIVDEPLPLRYFQFKFLLNYVMIAIIYFVLF